MKDKIKSPFDEQAVRDARRAYAAAKLSLHASEASDEDVEQAAWREAIAAGYTSLFQRRQLVVCPECKYGPAHCRKCNLQLLALEIRPGGLHMGGDPDAPSECGPVVYDCFRCAHTPHPGIVWADVPSEGMIDTFSPPLQRKQRGSIGRACEEKGAVPVSLSTCPKCYADPCTCSELYRRWSIENLKKQVKMPRRVLREKKAKKHWWTRFTWLPCGCLSLERDVEGGTGQNSEPCMRHHMQALGLNPDSLEDVEGWLFAQRLFAYRRALGEADAAIKGK